MSRVARGLAGLVRRTGLARPPSELEARRPRLGDALLAFPRLDLGVDAHRRTTERELAERDQVPLLEEAAHRPLGVGRDVHLPLLEAVEQMHVRLVTTRTATLEEAARVLGIDAATIYRKRKRWAAAPAAESVP